MSPACPWPQENQRGSLAVHAAVGRGRVDPASVFSSVKWGGMAHPQVARPAEESDL